MTSPFAVLYLTTALLPGKKVGSSCPSIQYPSPLSSDDTCLISKICITLSITNILNKEGGGVIPIQQTMNNFKAGSFINPNSGPSSLIPRHPLLCVIPQCNITNLKNPHWQPHSPILSQSFQNPWQKRRPNNLILHRLWILKHHCHPILIPSQKLVILIMRT